MQTFPELREKVIAIDIETKETLNLSRSGSGSHRHYLEGEDSYILGVAISDSKNDYYFEASTELFSWLAGIQNNHVWIGHNILYDLSWLYYENFKPEMCADTMGLVKLLDEDRQPKKGFSRPYSLSSCAMSFLDRGKNEAEITEFCETNNLRGSAQQWLFMMPVSLVSRYAKVDTRCTYDLYMALIHKIDEQNLQAVWEMETALIPILAQLNHKGLRIDTEKRSEASKELSKEIEDLKKWLFEKANKEFNTNSGKQLQVVFDSLGLKYKHTEKGNPSFKGDDLLPFGVEPDMEFFPHVLVLHNKLLKLKRDFVDRLQDFIVQGRIHPTINPYGTKTGRPTSNTPNIFQIPKRGRGKEICRQLFIPEEGEEWASMDYASEEYRVFAHYAIGPGSDNYRHKYNTKDDYDMHTENGRLAGVDRTKAKTIGLGVLFGMGKDKMAASLGVGKEEGLHIVAKFHDVNPAFKATSLQVESVARTRGYIHTILGRRRRLNKNSAYRGLNFLTQGNSADIAKLTIVEANRRGLLKKINFLFWLYDEYNISVKPENKQYVNEFKEIGENIIRFKVKMVLDLGYGLNWGAIK